MRSQMALDWIAREQVLITKTMMVMIEMMMVMAMVMMAVSGDPGDNCARVEPGGERPWDCKARWEGAQVTIVVVVIIILTFHNDPYHDWCTLSPKVQKQKSFRWVTRNIMMEITEPRPCHRFPKEKKDILMLASSQVENQSKWAAGQYKTTSGGRTPWMIFHCCFSTFWNKQYHRPSWSRIYQKKNI